MGGGWGKIVYNCNYSVFYLDCLPKITNVTYNTNLLHFFTEKDVYTWTLQTDIHKVHTFKFNRETCTKLFSSCCYDSPALDFLFFSLAGSPSHPGQQ